MAKARESMIAEQLPHNDPGENILPETQTGNDGNNGKKKINGVSDGGYGGQNIQILEGLEAVRVRPGMYIGATDQRGLHHLIY